MWNAVKPLVFRMDAEKAHHLTMQLFQWAVKLGPARLWFPPLGSRPEDLQQVECMGLTFPNPIGLAAGFDKDAKYYSDLSRLGFGFIEIGTVTPKPQAGNAKPRLFRLLKDEALINRLGFNNDGIEACVERLKKHNRPAHLILGGNIGKNKWTPNEQAFRDYEESFKALYPYVDYFVLNVSSPNTPGLRELQDKAPLNELLSHLTKLNEAKTAPRPMLLKVAPDVNRHQLADIAEVLELNQLAGCVVSNTTISRNALKTSEPEISKIGRGGLSGVPLFDPSTECLRLMREFIGDEKVLIGVGGVHSVETALAKMEAGANLVQIYSGLVYEGPTLIRTILKHL
jgi:dihydroorotate dehydrogenase